MPIFGDHRGNPYVAPCNGKYTTLTATFGYGTRDGGHGEPSAIPMPYVGPAIGLALGSRSPYVRFHAYRSLAEQIVLSLLTACLVAASVGWSLYSLSQSGFDLGKIDWIALVAKSLVVWLLLGLFGILNTLRNVLQGVQAFTGQRPQVRGWVARWSARRAELE